jgi:hypothetical protein
LKRLRSFIALRISDWIDGVIERDLIEVRMSSIFILGCICGKREDGFGKEVSVYSIGMFWF